MDIKSTYDCADDGIRVVVKYPACIMDNDRVRLYGRLPADVHSIARPTRYISLYYFRYYCHLIDIFNYILK